MMLGNRIYSGVMCLLFRGGLCPAQDQQPDLTQMSLEELSQVRVYSASKHLQTLSDAPSSVTVITRLIIDSDNL